MNNYFVNKFITIGLDNYFNNKNTDIFEKHVIKCLVFIYGEDEIKRTYQNKDEEAFTKLMRIYSLPLGIYSNMLGDMVSFEKYRELYKLDVTLKTDLMDRIDAKLITMYKYKSAFKKQSTSDVNKFEEILLRNFDVVKLRFNLTYNPNKTSDLWQAEKKSLLSNAKLMEVKPKYLDAYTYARYGTSLEEVKKMDYRMVNRLNEYITKKEKLDPVKPEKVSLGNFMMHTALSSGNGFVDFLCFMSVVVTELSIGAIYLFLHIKL